MEEFADTKEDENKKIVHTYPLVQVSVSTLEVIHNIYLISETLSQWRSQDFYCNEVEGAFTQSHVPIVILIYYLLRNIFTEH